MISYRAQRCLSYLAVGLLATGCTDRPGSVPIAEAGNSTTTVRIVNSVGMKFAAVPAGDFLMGSADPTPINKRASPQHRVRISRPFNLGVYEVTQKQYLTVMGYSEQHFTARGTGRSWIAGVDTSNLPADSVSWIQARWFCDALSKLPAEVEAGRNYRLPTESEWEYACRAGTRTPFSYGNTLTLAEANFCAFPDASGRSCPPLRTMPVGSYRPNALGLYDMHGNVWEWCQGGLREYSRSDQTDPQGRSHLQHVIRGGAWNYPAAYCRSDYRQAAARAYAFFGFRVVCEIDQKLLQSPPANRVSTSHLNDVSLPGGGSSGDSVLAPTTAATDAEPAKRSVAATRQGEFASSLPLGLRPTRVPDENPLTPEKIELGKQLFFDPRLSANDLVSCASCHNADKAWTNGEQYGRGIHGLVETRNVATLLNVAYLSRLFWDGRAESLEQLVLMPIEHEAEMGLPLDKLVDKLNQILGYRRQFAAIFGTDATETAIAQALSSFLRTLLSGDAPLDRYRAGDLKALSPAGRRGHDLFFFKAHCASCHRGPNLTDDFFHNIGIGMAGFEPTDETSARDLGRFEATGKTYHQGMFRTPTLREIAKTAPYMHDGRFKTLEEVVDFYEQGGEANPYLDRKMSVLVLTDEERADLVTFLKEGLSSSTTTEVEPPQLPE